MYNDIKVIWNKSMYKISNKRNKILEYLGVKIKPEREWQYVCGTKRVVLEDINKKLSRYYGRVKGLDINIMRILWENYTKVKLYIMRL